MAAGNYASEWKPTSAENPNYTCRNCGSSDIVYRKWESSDGAFNDLHYKCNNCKREWWFEGPDA